MLSDQELLTLLEELRMLLGEEEIIERYNYFVQNSTEGHQCVFAQKSLLMFQNRNLRSRIEDKLTQILSLSDKE